MSKKRASRNNHIYSENDVATGCSCVCCICCMLCRKRRVAPMRTTSQACFVKSRELVIVQSHSDAPPLTHIYLPNPSYWFSVYYKQHALCPVMENKELTDTGMDFPEIRSRDNIAPMKSWPTVQEEDDMDEALFRMTNYSIR